MTMLQPMLKWAQRKDKLYLTVDLQDCEDANIKVSNNDDGTGQFDFSGTCHGNKYELSTKLYKEVDAEQVQKSETARNVFLMVPKKEEGDHWPRLTPEKTKHNHIQVRLAEMPAARLMSRCVLAAIRVSQAPVCAGRICLTGCRQAAPACMRGLLLHTDMRPTALTIVLTQVCSTAVLPVLAHPMTQACHTPLSAVRTSGKTTCMLPDCAGATRVTARCVPAGGLGQVH